jgi:hypothetical protein
MAPLGQGQRPIADLDDLELILAFVLVFLVPAPVRPDAVVAGGLGGRRGSETRPTPSKSIAGMKICRWPPTQ